MNRTISLLLLITLMSCSSMKKTLIYSGLAGGMTGAAAGTLLSPDKESRGGNALIFGLLGAAVVAVTGAALYQDDPRNYKLKHMLENHSPHDEMNPNDLEIGLGQIKIDADLKKNEAYEVPLKKLPKELEGKVNKQFLIKYQSKERYIKKGNKTFYIPAFDVYEHAYGDKYEK